MKLKTDPKNNYHSTGLVVQNKQDEGQFILVDAINKKLGIFGLKPSGQPDGPVFNHVYDLDNLWYYDTENRYTLIEAEATSGQRLSVDFVNSSMWFQINEMHTIEWNDVLIVFKLLHFVGDVDTGEADEKAGGKLRQEASPMMKRWFDNNLLK